MNNYRPETKRNVLIALTTVYRNVINGKTVVSWTEAFTKAEVKNQRLIAKVKNALITMEVVKINGKHTYWNKNKTSPNPLLVDGIFKTIKENKHPVNRIDGKAVSKPSGCQISEVEKSKTEHIVWCLNKVRNIAGVPSILTPEIFETEEKARKIFKSEVKRVEEENKIALESETVRIVVSENSITLYNVEHPIDFCINLCITPITVK